MKLPFTLFFISLMSFCNAQSNELYTCTKGIKLYLSKESIPVKVVTANIDKDVEGFAKGVGTVKLYKGDTLYKTYKGRFDNGYRESRFLLTTKNDSVSLSYTRGKFIGDYLRINKNGDRFEANFKDTVNGGYGRVDNAITRLTLIGYCDRNLNIMEPFIKFDKELVLSIKKSETEISQISMSSAKKIYYGNYVNNVANGAFAEVSPDKIIVGEKENKEVVISISTDHNINFVKRFSKYNDGSSYTDIYNFKESTEYADMGYNQVWYKYGSQTYCSAKLINDMPICTGQSLVDNSYKIAYNSNSIGWMRGKAYIAAQESGTYKTQEGYTRYGITHEELLPVGMNTFYDNKAKLYIHSILDNKKVFDKTSKEGFVRKYFELITPIEYKFDVLVAYARSCKILLSIRDSATHISNSNSINSTNTNSQPSFSLNSNEKTMFFKIKKDITPVLFFSPSTITVFDPKLNYTGIFNIKPDDILLNEWVQKVFKR